jgi:hypothetical protein
VKSYRRIALQEQGWSEKLQEDRSPGTGLENLGLFLSMSGPIPKQVHGPRKQNVYNTDHVSYKNGPTAENKRFE